MTINDDKQDLRLRAKEKRSQAVADAGSEAAVRLVGNFIHAASSFPQTDSAVAAYWPMANEIDVRPLMKELHGQDRAVALPVVAGAAKPLIFRRWVPGMELEEGGFGTHHPGPEAPEIIPGILLVPLLAFDAQGFRLGWGGGFYDRTLAELRAAGTVLAVGVAYSGQKVDRVPKDSHDEALDWIITDRDVLEIS
ncbi:MAG: 5-formyltetrahydrofolate cyclo-ligase [Rhodospirillales bacterium]|nr:5-formyltetrahydrofolate cyclo-ligase [Rhodospirillales bacterium]